MTFSEWESYLNALAGNNTTPLARQIYKDLHHFADANVDYCRPGLEASTKSWINSDCKLVVKMGSKHRRETGFSWLYRYSVQTNVQLTIGIKKTSQEGIFELICEPTVNISRINHLHHFGGLTPLNDRIAWNNIGSWLAKVTDMTYDRQSCNVPESSIVKRLLNESIDACSNHSFPECRKRFNASAVSNTPSPAHLNDDNSGHRKPQATSTYNDPHICGRVTSHSCTQLSGADVATMNCAAKCREMLKKYATVCESGLAQDMRNGMAIVINNLCCEIPSYLPKNRIKHLHLNIHERELLYYLHRSVLLHAALTGTTYSDIKTQTGKANNHLLPPKKIYDEAIKAKTLYFGKHDDVDQACTHLAADLFCCNTEGGWKNYDFEQNGIEWDKNENCWKRDYRSSLVEYTVSVSTSTNEENPGQYLDKCVSDFLSERRSTFDMRSFKISIIGNRGKALPTTVQDSINNYFNNETRASTSGIDAANRTLLTDGELMCFESDEQIEGQPHESSSANVIT